jgi:hypothetical protein
MIELCRQFSRIKPKGCGLAGIQLTGLAYLLQSVLYIIITSFIGRVQMPKLKNQVPPILTYRDAVLNGDYSERTKFS